MNRVVSAVFRNFGLSFALGVLACGAWASADPNSTESPDSKVDWFSRVQLPKPKMEKLESGLSVVWFEDAHVPLVDLVLFLPVGYRMDPDGKSGMATLMGSLLERGTPSQDAKTLAQRLDQLGARTMVNLDDDFAIVGIHGLTEDFEDLAVLLRSVSLEADFAEREIARSKELLVDSVAKLGDQAGPLADLGFNRWLTAGTAYSRGHLWSTRELKSIQRNDLKRFHAMTFQPQSATLLVIGQWPKPKEGVVVAPSAHQILSAVFAKDRWPKLSSAESWKRPRRNLLRHPALPKDARAIWVVDRPGAVQAQIRMGFPGPLYHSPDRYALAVANSLLGRMFHSRLNTKVRDELGLTYGIGSHFNHSKELGIFEISASTQTENTLEAIAVTRNILQELVTTRLPTAEEIEKAKEFMIGEFPVEYSNVVALASRWMTGKFFGLGDFELHESIPNISRVSVADVHQALKRHFKLDRMRVVVSGDLKKLRATSKPDALKKASATSWVGVTRNQLLP